MASASDDEDGECKLRDERAKLDLRLEFGNGKRYDESLLNRRNSGHRSVDRHHRIDVDGDVPVTKYDRMTSAELEEERQRVRSGLNQVCLSISFLQSLWAPRVSVQLEISILVDVHPQILI
jgi:hypothetical protein